MPTTLDSTATPSNTTTPGKTDPVSDTGSSSPVSSSKTKAKEESAASESPISLTPKAIEMGKKALKRRGTPDAALRLGVRGGGCSGVQYAMEFSDKVRTRDNIYNFDGLRVVIDPKSQVYLRGTMLDYEFKLMEHGFKFRNPNEKKGCGCGESFGI